MCFGVAVFKVPLSQLAAAGHFALTALLKRRHASLLPLLEQNLQTTPSPSVQTPPPHPTTCAILGNQSPAATAATATAACTTEINQRQKQLQFEQANSLGPGRE
ncbi:hypothetical protein Ciccas_006350 [Cichlidogyrus casuarinus]|uniref:Uncharacterized protein n=1 Tax=Cichlidogyrus casuarinus TaxID=1844966 RepID=A0ABD2Q5Z9_9PLAT